MLSSAPCKIIIGISLDPKESKELLSWAITNLAHPHDTVVAIHVLVGEATKKTTSSKKKNQLYYSQIRHAKAHVISVLGEFAKTCRSKQVNLEARLAFSSSVGKGLITETEAISADILLLHGSRTQSNKNSNQVTRYCFEHCPEACTFVSLGTRKQAQKSSNSYTENSQGIRQSSHAKRGSSSTERTNIEAKTKSNNPSPRTVLDTIEEAESDTTEDDTFSFDSSSMLSQSSPLPSNLIGGKSNARKRMSPAAKIISSILSSPLIRKRSSGSMSGREKQQQPLLKCFSFEEISIATNNFHSDNLVGQGGYSEVYKGNLSDGRTIAVKRLTKDNKNANKEKEFLMELGIIGHVSHPNTATLVGCCIENGLYLIFNFSFNGNLASALHENETNKALDWEVRYKIVMGIARGLHYLHKGCKRRIIHRDIKASNVLLGPDFEPQITDFGLAKWLPNKCTHQAVISIEGTFGYLAPEYFMHGIVDEKTDVFAFGVLVLEIITGRKPVDSSKQNLLLWAMPLMESGKITELIDPSLGDEYDSDQAHGLVLTASYCVRQSSAWRPSMNEVLELLIKGEDSEAAKSWRMPKFPSSELDDYSMIFGYEVPSDIDLEDFL